MSSIVNRLGFGIPGIVGLIVPLLLVVLLFGFEDQLNKRPDSGAYNHFADTIISGEIFERKKVSEVRYGRAVRSPGYPLVVAVGKLSFADEERGILVIHLLVAIFSVAFLSIALRAYCPPIITGIIVVFAQFMMRTYFSALMTEWLAFNLLLLLFGLVVVSFRNPSIRNLFFVGFVATFAFLVRPSLAPVMLLMPMLVVYRWSLSIAQGAVLALTVLPLILWMGFNLYYLGAFKIAVHDGHAAFAVGSIVGHASIEPGDSEELINFITVMNKTKFPPKGAEDEFAANLDENYNMMLLQSNLYWKAYKLKPEGYGPIPFDREYLGVYGERALASGIENRVKYVLHGVKVMLLYGSPYVALYLLIIPLFGIYRKKNLLLSYAAIVMFSLYFAHGLLCAIVLVVFDRFLVVVFYPYLVSILICFFGLLVEEGVHKYFIQLLPGSVVNLVKPLFLST